MWELLCYSQSCQYNHISNTNDYYLSITLILLLDCLLYKLFPWGYFLLIQSDHLINVIDWVSPKGDCLEKVSLYYLCDGISHYQYYKTRPDIQLTVEVPSFYYIEMCVPIIKQQVVSNELVEPRVWPGNLPFACRAWRARQPTKANQAASARLVSA